MSKTLCSIQNKRIRGGEGLGKETVAVYMHCVGLNPTKAILIFYKYYIKIVEIKIRR